MKGQIDPLDLAALPLFLFGSLFELGLVDFSLGGVSLSETVFALGGTDISLAVILMLGALGAVIYTNEWEFDADGGITTWVVVATLGLIIAPPFVPALSEFLAQDIAASAALLVQTAGYTIVSYMG
jgi:hypothetical protein